jgi:hypothetical protein
VRHWQRDKSDAEITPKWKAIGMTMELLYNAPQPTVEIRGTQPIRAAQLAQLAAACQCNVVTSGAADYLLADISSVTGGTKEDCSEIVTYLDQCGAQALIWIDMDQLDMMFAALPAERCFFLVDADDALAVPILSGMNRRASMDQLYDKNREGEYGALHKISDELADFARTLARIAEQEGDPLSAVNETPVSFRPAPAAIFAPLASQATASAIDPTPAAVRELIKLRRMRELHFPPGLFADPGWDILLDLFAAKLEGKSVSVSSLCIAAAVPPTTALRWITTMTENGALVRRQDPQDARRVFIELSAESEERLRSFFADAKAKASLPI